MKFSVPVVEVKNLFLQRQDHVILKEISFVVKRGDYIAIIGPNGGGKTTLTRIILGLQKFDRGTVKLFGKDLKSFNNWDKIGYVPQRVTQIDTNFPATVLEVVRMGRTAKRGFFSKMKDEDHEAIEDAMLKMDVLNLKDRLIGDLSGGQRQRVMIARALASKPELLILDEPNTGVDTVSQQKFYRLLKKLNDEEQMSILFVTHDIGVIADDIGRLFTVNQNIVVCNDPKDLMGCNTMSELYGIDAHLLSNHHHH